MHVLNVHNHAVPTLQQMEKRLAKEKGKYVESSLRSQADAVRFIRIGMDIEVRQCVIDFKYIAVLQSRTYCSVAPDCGFDER